MSRRERPCPGCGKILITDDEAHAILHEAPECSWFLEIMATARPADEVTRVPGAGVDVHLDALRTRVRLRKN